MKLKFILPVLAGLVSVTLPAAAYFYGHHGDASSPGPSSPIVTTQGPSPKAKPQPGNATVHLTAQRGIPSGFDATLEAALMETDPVRRRADALRQWADAVGTGSMETMLVKLGAIENPPLRAEVRKAVLASWAKRDINSMIVWFCQQKEGDEWYQQARDALIGDFGDREPTAMLAWMEQILPESTRAELYGPFFQQWAQSDPLAAATRLRQLSEAPRTNSGRWNEMIGQVVAVWAKPDLNGALAWIQSLPDGAFKSQALTEVSYPWVATAPQAAATYAASQNDPDLLEFVAGKWAETDPARAAAWAARLPAGDERDSATIGAAITWAQQDPAAAAAFASGLSTEEERVQAMVAVFSAWSTAAPAQAAAWVGQIPESPTRAQAMGQLMSSWAGTDATAASQWLKTLPPSPSRDSAIAAYDNAVSVYSSALSATSPASAFQRAGAISNENLRNQSLKEIATAWLSQDPANARQKIAQSTLPATIKNELLKDAARQRL